MLWYFPSFSGDFRLQARGEESDLLLMKPTLYELSLLHMFLQACEKKGYAPSQVDLPDTLCSEPLTTVTLKASVADAGKLLLKFTKPKKKTLTAVSFSGGKLEVAEGSDSQALDDLVHKAASAPSGSPTPVPAPASRPEKTTKAVSVARPTPCCPQCEVGAVAPANEVLQAFLTPEQHEQWAAERTLVAVGNLTGTRYLLAHRNTRTAARIGRICLDLDEQVVVHFHDRTVPPEEEVLGAKLILEHREHWLRNEATYFASSRTRFKNPFGDASDGVWDASLTQGFGAGFQRSFEAALLASKRS